MIIFARTCYSVIIAFLAYAFIVGMVAIRGEGSGFIYSGLDSGVTWAICLLSGLALVIALYLASLVIPTSDADDDESGYIVQDFRGM